MSEPCTDALCPAMFEHIHVTGDDPPAPADRRTVDRNPQGPMRFAYADPPYLGVGYRYAEHHPEALVWDNPERHRELIDSLSADYPDGWALSLSSTSLHTLLPMCPPDVRVTAWVKPWAAFKRNVRVAYTWEPVIVRGGRKSSADGAPPCRDHISLPMTMRKGLVGAKPEAFCRWVMDLLGWKQGDELVDLFPGTHVFDRVLDTAAQEFDFTQEEIA